MGNLFISNFKRKKIDSDEYMIRLIRYIHFNPVNHGFTSEIANWKFSSYNILTSTAKTFLARDKVIAWYGSVEQFKRGHEKNGGVEKNFGFDK
jgi:hypothetical protein